MKNGFLKVIALTVVLASVISLFCACGDAPAVRNKRNQTEPQEQTETKKDTVEKKSFLFYYDQLTKTEKAVYDGILASTLKGEQHIDFELVNTDEYSSSINKAVYALTLDYPELYWLQGSYTGETSGPTEKGKVSIDIWYYNVDHSENGKRELENRITQVVDEVNSLNLTNDYEKALYVHDYLVNNCEYDTESLSTNDSLSFMDTDYIYTAYGCLVKGKAVCAGYSEAYKIILERLNIKNTLVFGYANEDHQWNAVFLDGEFYHVDLAWDDPLQPAGINLGDFISHDYCFIDDEAISRSHEKETRSGLMPPLCSGKKYDYYKMNGYYLEAYSYENAASIIKGQRGPVYAVKFATYDEFEKAVDDLILNGHIYDTGLFSYGYNYSKDINIYSIKIIHN